MRHNNYIKVYMKQEEQDYWRELSKRRGESISQCVRLMAAEGATATAERGQLVPGEKKDPT
jgi:hypothetical protein